MPGNALRNADRPVQNRAIACREFRVGVSSAKFRLHHAASGIPYGALKSLFGTRCMSKTPLPRRRHRLFWSPTRFGIDQHRAVGSERLHLRISLDRGY